MAFKHVNAVVVGAGAGGGIVAKELAVNGFSVVLLERGKWQGPWDCRKDDLRNQRTSILGHAFGPDDERNPRVLIENDRERILAPSSSGYNNNAACVGGGTLSYGAMAWRFMEKDFRLLSSYWPLEGSSLADWPISYNDLEPHYTKAEYEIGVSGDVSGDPFKGPRSRPLPMPALPPTREHEILEKAALRRKWHPFSIPMLRNSVPYNGRPACMRCRWCVGFACEVNAKCGTQNTVIPTALGTGLCELRTECMVKQVLTGDNGKATGIEYFDADNKLQTQTADLVIVAGAAIESARLLLNSKTRLFPNGLGNRYDQVGRNLQGHTYSGAIGIFDEVTYDDLGPGASIAFCDFNHGNPGLVGGGMLCNEFIRLPYQFIERVSAFAPKWGKAHKDFVRQSYSRTISVQGPTQEIPVPDSRVQVDPKVKDFWGIPVARMSGQKHPHSVEIARHQAGRAEEWLKEAGALKTWKRIPGRGLSGGQHQAGTCRMGDDPKTSVVNRYCQVHDVENLFVVDGSVHVNNGGFNPVLTIMAVAYWASEHIVKTRKGGRA